MEMAVIMQIDRIDRKIISVLSTEGRITLTNLSRRVGLSKSPCQTRVKRLEELGVITGYRALFDPVKLGLDHVAFVEVKLEDTREEALRRFNSAVVGIPEVEQCHMIAGNYDYLLKVRTQNISDYRRVLGEAISSLPFVSQTSTYVAMETVKDELSKGMANE